MGEKKEAENEREEELVEDENQVKKVVNEEQNFENIVCDHPTFDLNVDLTRESAKEVDSQKTVQNEVKEVTPPLAAEGVIDVDEMVTPNEEVGEFLPQSRMRNIYLLLDCAEREVVQ